MVLFKLLSGFGLNVCYRCGGIITTAKELSIEHETAWQSASNPKEAFWDLDNVSFSHLTCNVQALRVTHCPQGHEYTDENTVWGKHTKRTCRKCIQHRNKIWYHSDEYKRKRKDYPSRKRI